MADNTGNHFGNYIARATPSTAGKQPLILEITTEVTGYTCQYIYGKRENKYDSIVVPTYKLNVIKDGVKVASYNVTRDAWYCRGIVSEGGFFGIGATNKVQLVNRCFEPQMDDMNYTTVPSPFPQGAGVDAFALRSKGSTYLNAVAHSKEMQTYVDGKPIDDARKSPYDKTSDVMIHIAGWFKSSKNKLAGSYGCFGLTPKSQIVSSKAEAEKLRRSRGYENFAPSNEAYKIALNTILKASQGRSIWVNIKKRSGVLTIMNE